MFGTLCLFPFGRRQAQMLCIVASMDQKDSFGSTVDTCCVDPTGWTLAYDHKGRQYFWHRRTRCTVWEIPESATLRMKGMRKRKKKKWFLIFTLLS